MAPNTGQTLRERVQVGGPREGWGFTTQSIVKHYRKDGGHRKKKKLP